MDEILSSFSNLYGTRISSSFICDDLNWKGLCLLDSSLLEVPFTEKEMREAVFEMDYLKSLGRDDMTREYYKKSWNILKSNLVRVLQDFSKTGIFNKRCNETNVCLIPKKEEVPVSVIF